MEEENQIEEFLHLEAKSEMPDTEMIKMISARVSKMLDSDPDLLMSYLYRLDVLEVKIKAVLNQPKGLSIPDALAKLIWERQKERLAIKKKYKQKPIEGWEF